MTDRRSTPATAGRIVAYLKGKGRVPGKELATYLNMSERRMRDHIAYCRNNICWINSCSTSGSNGYSIGEPDTRQLKSHGIAELAACRAAKKYAKHAVMQEELAL